MSEEIRHLVQIKKIDAINPIKNADAIEVATIGGWKAVIQKNQFKVGDKVLYFEIDTFLPANVPEFEFLMARSKRDVLKPGETDRNDAGNFVSGHVLKTMKLRSQVSQGLILPLSFGLTENSSQEKVDEVFKNLGVFKYEPEVPDNVKDVFPTLHGIKRTHSERVQNLTDEFLSSLDENEWTPTEKINGESSTFYMLEDGLHIAGRGWEIDAENSKQGKLAKELDLASIMPIGSVIQGEIFGEGIHGNTLKIKGTRLLVFSAESPNWTPEFTTFVSNNLVPDYDLTLPKSVAEAVEQVNGLTSLINPSVQAEGIVWWNKLGDTFEELSDRASFKCINNKFLLKHEG